MATANSGTILKDCVNYASINNSFSNGRIGGLACYLNYNSGLENCENRGNVETSASNTTTGGMAALIEHNGYIQGGANYGMVSSKHATYYGLVAAYMNGINKVDGVTVSGQLFNNGTEKEVTAENFIDDYYIGRYVDADKAKITNCTYVAP